MAFESTDFSGKEGDPECFSPLAPNVVAELAADSRRQLAFVQQLLDEAAAAAGITIGSKQALSAP